MKKIQRINETKSGFFEKINKIDKCLSKLRPKERQKTQIIKIEMKREISTDTRKMWIITRIYFTNLYST